MKTPNNTVNVIGRAMRARNRTAMMAVASNDSIAVSLISLFSVGNILLHLVGRSLRFTALINYS